MLVSFLRQLFGRRPWARSDPQPCLEALRLGRLEAAAECFRTYLVGQPRDVDAQINFGVTLQRLGRYDEALACFAMATRLAPRDPVAWYDAGVIHHLRGDLVRAENCYRSAIAADPAYPEAHREYSMLRLYYGDYSREAWSSFRQRRRCAGFELTVSRCPAPLWNGEPIEGKTILTYGEQGLGDEILFASCYRDLIAQASHCVIETEPRLESLFRRSFPSATVFGRHREAELAALYPSVNFQVPCGDLPMYFRTSANAFPARVAYLTADAGAVERWRRKLASFGSGLKVGISWRGGTQRTRHTFRSVALDHWRPIFGVAGSHFISLQYGDCSKDLARPLGISLHHWPEVIADYDETAALVRALDLVITVTTSAAHLAGALGQKVWILANAAPRWCYGAGGSAMPWYPSARLFRQRQPGAWDAAMGEVAAALALERR